jgi:hypothetical protein
MDTGIEQRVISPHRTDFMDPFQNGEYITIPLSKKSFDDEKGSYIKRVTFKKE